MGAKGMGSGILSQPAMGMGRVAGTLPPACWGHESDQSPPPIRHSLGQAAHTEDEPGGRNDAVAGVGPPPPPPFLPLPLSRANRRRCARNRGAHINTHGNPRTTGSRLGGGGFPSAVDQQNKPVGSRMRHRGEAGGGSRGRGGARATRRGRRRPGGGSSWGRCTSPPPPPSCCCSGPQGGQR